MCTKNLSLLFAPSLFQTDGKGEHEVKIVEDLIDNYLYVFDVSRQYMIQLSALLWDSPMSWLSSLQCIEADRTWDSGTKEHWKNPRKYMKNNYTEYKLSQ